jgi:hypothetical protein
LTVEAYKEWKQTSESQPIYWRWDRATMNSSQTLLLYRGIECGQFISITNTGLVVIGNFSDATQGITDCQLETLAQKKYADWTEAYEKVGTEFGIFWVVMEVEKWRNMKRMQARRERDKSAR